MDGLLEWHLVDGSGVQVWQEPARAGRSTVVLGVADVDGTAARLEAAGLGPAVPEDGGGGRVVQLHDADGNRVVLLGT